MPFGIDLDPFRHSWNNNNRPLKWPSRILGIACGALFIASEHLQNQGVAYWAKALFLSGAVLLPLIVLNRDLKRSLSAWIMLLVLIGIHIGLVELLRPQLPALSFVVLAPVAFAEFLLLNAPLLLLREHLGIEYPSSQPTDKN